MKSIRFCYFTENDLQTEFDQGASVGLNTWNVYIIYSFQF